MKIILNTNISCYTSVGMICSRQLLNSLITWLMATSCSTFSRSRTTDTTHSKPLLSTPFLDTNMEIYMIFIGRSCKNNSVYMKKHTPRMEHLFYKKISYMQWTMTGVFPVWCCQYITHSRSLRTDAGDFGTFAPSGHPPNCRSWMSRHWK